MEEKIDYEKSIARLEEITASLESGKLSLEDMIKLYSEGTKIAASCTKSLSEAQTKITKINFESNSDE